MEDIPAHDVRNDAGAALRRVAADERLRITFSGRPVAERDPLATRPRSVRWDAFLNGADDWRADAGLATDLATLISDRTQDV